MTRVLGGLRRKTRRAADIRTSMGIQSTMSIRGEPIKTGGNNKVEKWWLFKNTKGKLVTVMRHDTDPEHPEIHYHVGQPKIGSTLSPGGRIIYKPIEGEPQANIAMTAVESENGAFLFAADDE